MDTSAGRREPICNSRRAALAVNFKVTPLVTQDLCVGERLRTYLTECGMQFCFGFPFRAQDPVTVGDSWLYENSSPLGDGKSKTGSTVSTSGRVGLTAATPSASIPARLSLGMSKLI